MKFQQVAISLTSPHAVCDRGTADASETTAAAKNLARRIMRTIIFVPSSSVFQFDQIFGKLLWVRTAKGRCGGTARYEPLSVAISDRLEPVVFVGIAALRPLAAMFAVTRPQNRL